MRRQRDAIGLQIFAIGHQTVQTGRRIVAIARQRIAIGPLKCATGAQRIAIALVTSFKRERFPQRMASSVERVSLVAGSLMRLRPKGARKRLPIEWGQLPIEPRRPRIVTQLGLVGREELATEVKRRTTGTLHPQIATPRPGTARRRRWMSLRVRIAGE